MTAPAPSQGQARAYRRVYTNGKGGSCKGCREFVSAVAGVAAEPILAAGEKPGWDLFCRACAEKRGLSLPYGDEHFTAILRDAGHVVLRPRRSLVGPTFDRAREIWTRSGGRFDADTGDTVLPIERAMAAVQNLQRELGLDVKDTVNYASELARQKTADSAARHCDPKLFPYQFEGALWLAPRRRALLDDEMGLGKTVQALSALPRGPDRAPVLVICTASARGVWEDEAARWRPDYRCRVISRRVDFGWPDSGEIVIATYDVRVPDVTVPPPRPRTILVTDEAQAIKNPQAARTIRTRAVAGAALRTGGSVWLLTGTPLDRHPEDLWHLLRAADLEIEAFGSFENFQKLYQCKRAMHPCPECKHMRRHSAEKGCHERGCGKRCSVKNVEHLVWGDPTPEVRARLERVSLRRTRAQVLPELPEKRYQDHRIELVQTWGHKIDSFLPADWQDRLQSLLDSPEELPELPMFSNARAVLAEAKADAALEIVESFEDQDEPLVVFSCHTQPLSRFVDRPGWGLIEGGTPAKKRKELADAFQRGELRGLAGNVVAMGTALTLTRAAHCLHIDEPWSFAQFDQACDRLCRIGQTRGVVVHRLVATHALDLRVRELLERKRRVAQGSLGDG